MEESPPALSSFVVSTPVEQVRLHIILTCVKNPKMRIKMWGEEYEMRGKSQKIVLHRARATSLRILEILFLLLYLTLPSLLETWWLEEPSCERHSRLLLQIQENELNIATTPVYWSFRGFPVEIPATSSNKVEIDSG